MLNPGALAVRLITGINAGMTPSYHWVYWFIQKQMIPNAGVTTKEQKISGASIKSGRHLS